MISDIKYFRGFVDLSYSIPKNLMEFAMAIAWSESMATGIAAVDAQHQRLIEAVNYLVAALSHGIEARELERVIHWLTEYADKHFTFEECCMDKYSCPTAGANQLAHEEFRQFLADFARQKQSGASLTDLAITAEQHLSNWLLNYLCGVDAALAACTRNSPAKF